MLVNKTNFEACFAQLIEECAREKEVGFDTETTTLFWWPSPHYDILPRVFSMQFSTAETDYYFDFGCEESMRGSDYLGAEHFARFKGLFGFKDLTWYIQNAKFDMHHSYNHDLFIAGTIHCTQAMARVMNNLEDGKKVSLDSLSQTYLGAEKIDLSEFWKPEDGRVTKIKRPGENGSFYDFYHFDKLPLDILVKYGERDTRLVYRLGKFQVEQIRQQSEKYFGAVPSNFGGNLLRVMENERQLTKTLFWVERRGVQLDLPFVQEALKHAYKGIRDTLDEIDKVAQPYVDAHNATPGLKESARLKVMDWNSGPCLKGLFDSLKIPYNFTEKGTASFDKDALEASKHPLAKKILEYRRHSKRAHTYLENYIWLADKDGVLHCNFSQGGPETGRMSCREPNMQNVPKRADKKESDFVLRKCFVPRPGKLLVSMDYDQVEYRLMLDYAREMALINRILNEGLDVHDATEAELELTDRDEAKTMNFMLLYGGGVPKLADALFDIPCSMEELKAVWMLHKWPTWRRPEYERDKTLRANVAARGELPEVLEKLKQAENKLLTYFRKLPAVETFISNVKDKAKKQGVIFTWLGRVLQYGKDAKGGHTNYKAPNGLIQGGAGDLSKVAINDVHAELCAGYTSPMEALSYLILHVHDELVAEIDVNEKHLVPVLVDKMQKAYPHRLIPLTAGAAWSEKSWGDLQDGVP